MGFDGTDFPALWRFEHGYRERRHLVDTPKLMGGGPVVIGFPTCPECGGSGEVEFVHGGHAGNLAPDMDMRPCLSCVEGVVITDELRLLTARTHYEAWWEGKRRPWDLLQQAECDLYLEVADAVLVAAVRHLKAEGGT